MNLSKKLIMNADDFGRCAEVNLAVEQAARTGLLGGVSVLANSECWEEAVSFLRDHPELSAGVHLNVVEGRPVSRSTQVRVLTGVEGTFFGLTGLLSRWVLRPAAVSRAVEIEWKAQIKRLIQAGASITHLDSHQHVHAFPPAYRCAVRLCKEYGIPAIRHPREHCDLRVRQASGFALQSSLAIARRMSRSNGLYHNDYFLGFKRAGAYGTTELIDDLRAMPNGVTELALHPSVKDGVPYSKLSGARELAALVDETLPGRLGELGIEVTTWTEASR